MYTSVRGPLMARVHQNLMNIFKPLTLRENNVEFLMVLRTDAGLTHLDIPEGTRIVSCSYNQLEHIDLPEGVCSFWARNNKFKELHFPKSLSHLECDKELFDYDKCDVEWVNIYYE